jgi:hypothetical protein
MFFLAGQAASSALDLISALQQTLAGKNSPAVSTPPTAAPTFDPNAAAGDATAPTGTSAPATPLAPTTMGAMLTVQGSNGQTLVNGDAFSSQLFGLLDGNNDGSISKSEFEAAFNKNGDTTKADAIFAQLDANHDGSVSPTELTNALSGQGQADGGQQVGHRHHHHHGMSGAGGASPPTGSGDPNNPFSTSASGGSNDPFAGDQSQTVTNADGSSTTTITYGDGSQVSMTLPAASGSGTNSAAWEHNVIERMIQRQAQMMAASPTGQGLAISA